MTQDEIVKMAREAGLVRTGDKWVEPARWGVTELIHFAALVAAAERQAVLDTVDALMGMERDRNPMFSEGYDYALEHIEQFVKGRK